MGATMNKQQQTYRALERKAAKAIDINLTDQTFNLDSAVVKHEKRGSTHKYKNAIKAFSYKVSISVRKLVRNKKRFILHL